MVNFGKKSAEILRFCGVEKYDEEFGGEEEINALLNQFTANMKKCYGGINTVQAQIAFPSLRGGSALVREITFYTHLNYNCN